MQIIDTEIIDIIIRKNLFFPFPSCNFPINSPIVIANNVERLRIIISINYNFNLF